MNKVFNKDQEVWVLSRDQSRWVYARYDRKLTVWHRVIIASDNSTWWVGDDEIMTADEYTKVCLIL